MKTPEQASGTAGTVRRKSGRWEGAFREAGGVGGASAQHDGRHLLHNHVVGVPMETKLTQPFFIQRSLTTRPQHGSGRARAQQLCCGSPLLLLDFLPSTSVG